jgi:AbrB family looped-hinge helix DNA binding protein
MDILQIDQTSSVTKKGQVTIPAYFRNKLGIKTGTKIYFEIDADRVTIKPIKYSLDSAYASVKPLKKKLSLEEVRKIAREDHLNANS